MIIDNTKPEETCLSDKEWNEYLSFFPENGTKIMQNPHGFEQGGVVRVWIDRKAAEHKKELGNRCILCGQEKNKNAIGPMCVQCYARGQNKGMVRGQKIIHRGKKHREKWTATACERCGSPFLYAAGMCRHCYDRRNDAEYFKSKAFIHRCERNAFGQIAPYSPVFEKKTIPIIPNTDGKLTTSCDRFYPVSSCVIDIDLGHGTIRPGSYDI